MWKGMNQQEILHKNIKQKQRNTPSLAVTLALGEVA